ncbi:hypothetical protein Vretimale_11448 [Volvox reticuliferus]|uniref:Uncharacterized protein n=1 Tax=Volvox reticuliferus TaxID=1737510 RepID=A0A8J4LRI6_9CHLO|nr:hypothetical protein Vretifemale_11974 [Volvox reticuliferus]GIM07250.1 hypothetical protein Vretimale_11448 [Volvox reticuliferus]
MSSISSGRMDFQIDAPSTSSRLDTARRVPGMRSVHRSFAASIPLAVRDIPAPTAPRVVMCEAAPRPPAGPSTILCSSLGKERKKLAKVLKSHRKVLEKRLSALTRSEVDAPVLSELLSELRALTSRLDNQRAATLLANMDESDSSSDSDDDGCDTRSAAALCSRRASSLHEALPQLSMVAVNGALSEPSTSPGTAAEPSVDSTATRMVVSSIVGEIEVPVPAPEEGWNWDEDEFRAAKFDGAGGRVMVCTGSKCQRKGATEVLRAVSALSTGNSNIEVIPCKCVGKCSAGAALRVRPMGQPCATYTQVRPSQLRDVFLEHFTAPPAPPVQVMACALDHPPHMKLPIECCAECQGH